MSRPVRLLIVEDSEDDALLLVRELRRADYDVTFECVDERQAMSRALASGTWDLILADYSMPHFNGIEAMELLQKSDLDIPFIFVSGAVGENTAVAAMKAGAHDYVMKGNLRRLVPAIERELREAEVRRERKRAEEELRRSREQLRALSAYLQSVREEERVKIAREIHDDLGQSLTALKMDLSWLKGRLSEDRSLQEKAETMMELIDSTIHTVRRIAAEARPAVLDNLGLVAAIEWQAQDFQKRIGIRCEMRKMFKDIQPDQDISTTLFRIFQETLTNAARHAKATRVEISLEERKSNLILEVKDNGRGITEEEVYASNSLGILGMRERAFLLGGELQIRGVPGKGTTVAVRVPLNRSQTDYDKGAHRG